MKLALVEKSAGALFFYLMEFYRYQYQEYASIDQDGEYYSPKLPNPKLELSTFRLIKETPKGYWIGYEHWFSFRKWVSKTARKRYAYPTKEEALESFIKRTQRRIRILGWQKQCCEISVNLAKQLKSRL